MQASSDSDLDVYNVQGEGVEDEDDGLGYYHDGVKRTLTDDQIAMFRHSEIYSIVRKRQVLKENLEAEANAKLHESDTSPGPGANTISNNRQVIHDENDDSEAVDDQEEYMRFMEAERKDMQVAHMSKKRKINSVRGSKWNSRAPTHRRIVRELDDAGTSNDVLDYGEEPIAASGTSKATLPNSSKHINRANNSDCEPRELISTTNSSHPESNDKVAPENISKPDPPTQETTLDHRLAVQKALKEWCESIPSIAVTGNNAKFALNQKQIDDISEIAPNVHSVKDLRVASMGWDKELIEKYADEIFHAITNAAGTAKAASPPEGRKIWWPTIGQTIEPTT